MRSHRIALPAMLVGATVLLSGCPCGEEVQGELTPFSGRFGYFVAGPWGFEGALTKENLGDPEWTIEGTFQFPSSGYTVLAPEVQVAESYPEQVLIRIRVLTPSPGQVVLPVITEAPVSFTIPASDRAEFDVWFVPVCLAPD